MSLCIRSSGMFMKTTVSKSAIFRALPIRCVGLLLLLAASSRCPAQLNARPGAVLLIARLESLSVSTDANGSESRNRVYSDGDSVSLTTSWAVPANLTTLRVLGYVQSTPQAPNSGEVAPCKRVSSPADIDSDRRCGYGVRSIPVTLFSQTAGETRQAASRTDDVHLPSHDAPGILQNDLKRDTVIVVVQAL